MLDSWNVPQVAVWIADRNETRVNDYSTQIGAHGAVEQHVHALYRSVCARTLFPRDLSWTRGCFPAIAAAKETAAVTPGQNDAVFPPLPDLSDRSELIGALRLGKLAAFDSDGRKVSAEWWLQNGLRCEAAARCRFSAVEVKKSWKAITANDTAWTDKLICEAASDLSDWIKTQPGSNQKRSAALAWLRWTPAWKQRCETMTVKTKMFEAIWKIVGVGRPGLSKPGRKPNAADGLSLTKE